MFSKENKGMLTKDQGKSSSAQQKLQAAILSAIYDAAFRIWIELYLFIYCFLYLLFTALSAPDPNDRCLFFCYDIGSGLYYLIIIIPYHALFMLLITYKEHYGD